MKAKIITENGKPALYLDGKKQVPMLLFVNTEADGGLRRDICKIQVRQSAEKGLHLYSSCCHLSVNGKLEDRDLSPAIEAVRCVAEEDPQAAVLLRINFSLYGAEAEEWAKTHPGETVQYAIHTENFPQTKDADGNDVAFAGTAVSIASDAWLAESVQTLERLIDWFEAHPELNDHIMGYHIAAEDAGEWFHTGLRENGIDISPVNREAYRQWLYQKYWPRPEGLTDEWGLNPKVYTSFSAVDLPYDIPGNDRSLPLERSLFTDPLDRRYIDYSDYSSELTVDRIAKLCRTVKEKSAGDKITLVFYGYYYELYDARTGHFRLNEILSNPDVDALAGPISYLDRNEGGTGAVMSPVDSIALHGKLWFQENDIRTGQILREHGIHDEDGWLSKPIRSVENLLEVYEREWTQMAAHGIGCWYMDLPARGWISHPEQWNLLRRLNDIYAQQDEKFGRLEPDVAVVVDERAMSVIAHAEEVGTRLMYSLRQLFYRAGIRFGWYTAADVENGLVPSAKVIWHLDPFRMDAGNVDRLKAVASRQNAALVLMHGFGTTPDALVRELTGMTVSHLPYTLENLDMQPTEWFPANKIFLPDAAYLEKNVLCPFYRDPNQMARPAYFVEPEAGVRVLCRYTKGNLRGRIGAAMKDCGDYRTVFVGAYQLTADGIREICRLCGVHIYSESADAMMIGNHIFSVHADETAGVRTVRFPRPTALTALDGTSLGTVTELTREFKPYETFTCLYEDEKTE